MGWTQRLGDGRYRAFESSGSGSGRVRANAIGATRRDARSLAQAKLAKKQRESSLEPHTLTLTAYLQRWFSHLKSGHASAHTVETYESIARRHLPPALGDTKLADLKPLPIQRALDDRLASASPNSVRKQYKMLHAALRQAVAWRLLLSNPMDDVTPPLARRAEMAALSEDETAALLGGLSGFWHAASLVAVTTGLRRGELLALEWRHVRPDAIDVRQVVEESKGPPRLRPYPKTVKSWRTVTLMEATATALRGHRKLQVEARMLDKDWHDLDLVFPADHGALWRPSAFSRQWGELGAVLLMRQQMGRHLRLHDLRHTHATQLLRAGVPVDAVAKRLGHSSPVITMTTYAHVLEDADSAAVDRLEASLGARLAGGFGTEVGT